MPGTRVREVKNEIVHSIFGVALLLLLASEAVATAANQSKSVQGLTISKSEVLNGTCLIPSVCHGAGPDKRRKLSNGRYQEKGEFGEHGCLTFGANGLVNGRQSAVANLSWSLGGRQSFQSIILFQRKGNQLSSVGDHSLRYPASNAGFENFKITNNQIYFNLKNLRIEPYGITKEIPDTADKNPKVITKEELCSLKIPIFTKLDIQKDGGGEIRTVQLVNGTYHDHDVRCEITGSKNLNLKNEPLCLATIKVSYRGIPPTVLVNRFRRMGGAGEIFCDGIYPLANDYKFQTLSNIHFDADDSSPYSENIFVDVVGVSLMPTEFEKPQYK